MVSTEKLELKHAEPFDVSFAEIQPDKDWKQTVQKIATAINVQFTESSQQDLPFVPFKEFQSLLREQKIFLFGPSGCGKSRTIIELVRNNGRYNDHNNEEEENGVDNSSNDNNSGNNSNYKKIFVINPSNPSGLDTHRRDISLLSLQFSQHDLVIWDNFPEGLVKRDLQSAFSALEILNSRPLRNLYIALKPSYLEIYRGLTLDIPDIYPHEVSCDLATMKTLLKTYGKEVPEYKEIFEKHVSKDSDRISRVLWQKQPLYLTVVDFYKALLAREIAGTTATAGTTWQQPWRNNDDNNTVSSPSLSEQRWTEQGLTTTSPTTSTTDITGPALAMAQAWLPVHDYFQRQFEVMKNIDSRQNDVDFLYTLRFCYEVGFDRTHDSIARLQKEIFGSSPPADPSRKLATWIYLSGRNYSMHDSAKNAVTLSDYSKMRIISYFTNQFQGILPLGDGELYSLGLFLGRNIQYGLSDLDHYAKKIVPDEIYKFMKTNAVFERAIGRGVGENFELLEDSLQDSILEFVDTEIEFGVGLADSLGERFAEIDKINRQRVLEKIYHGMLFARYLGQSIGRMLFTQQFPSKLRQIVLSHAERNPQFADGLGMGLGYVYPLLEPGLQKEITLRAQKSFELSRGIGFGFGLTLPLLPTEKSKQVVELADKNSELDAGFGMGMAAAYSNLSPELRKLVLERAARDTQFAFGFGIYAAFTYKQFVPPEIFSMLGSNTEVAYGLGLGYGTSFFYLPAEFQSKLELLTKNESKVDDGLGIGIGLVLKHLPPEVQGMFFERASSRNAFATGLGYGIGFTWHYIGNELRTKALTIAKSNNDFAQGLGIGLGSHIDYLKHAAFFDQIIGFADTNGEFDFGLGAGSAWALRYCSDETKNTIHERMKTKREFARGLGFGLARMIQHFSADERERLMYEYILSEAVSSDGFGEGTGHYIWSALAETGRKQFVEFAAKHPEISRGLGEGIGFLYSYFVNDLYNNGPLGRLFKKDPSFRNGLGRGMGRAFAYLTEQARTEAFQIAEENVDFATGLGEGLSTVYIYLDKPQRDLVMQLTKGEGDETGFSRGVGIGLGSMFSYFQDDLKNEILARVRNNNNNNSDNSGNGGQFSRGIGIGLGRHFAYLPEVLWNKLFELANNNNTGNLTFAAGLGEGCGLEFPRLPLAIKNKLSSGMSTEEFAFGVGLGIGNIIISRLVDRKSVYEEAKGLFGKKGTKFSEGFAIGFASSSSIATLLSDDEGRNEDDNGLLILFQVLSEVQKDAEFARSFGFGLAHIFSILPDNMKSRIMDTIGRNEDFMAGLGTGLGYHLPSIGTRVVEEAILSIRSERFQIGLARGFAASFKYLSMPEVLGILEYANAMPEYGKVLGENLAEMFASFDGDKQTALLDIIQRNIEFSRAFSSAIGRNMQYVSPLVQERIRILKENFSHLRNHNPDLHGQGISKQETQQAVEEEDHNNKHREIITRRIFNSFPMVGLSTTREQTNWKIGKNGKGEITFFGKVQECCVCFIDMISSTKISSNLSAAQLSRYYEIFLNGIAQIAENFGAKIVKNVGDALIFYFDNLQKKQQQPPLLPQADDNDDNNNNNNTSVKSKNNFKNVLDCCLTMSTASGVLNAKMFSERLPPIQYRISADYGEVSIAKSSSSQSEDLFGSAMNICAKINSKAQLNGFVIGQMLFDRVNDMSEYTFIPAREKLVMPKGEYNVYHVEEKEKRTIINPFEWRGSG
jgi:class 3 adenylate cyclase